jgi:XRE family transcriptional regulator, regulator of sulfur utilization
MNLGKIIKDIRKQKKFTQNQFAEMCNITQAYLSQIENNAKEPNLSTLKTISEKLETPLPIMFFLSLENSDIKPEKEEAYKMIAPSVQSLISKFFVG